MHRANSITVTSSNGAPALNKRKTFISGRRSSFLDYESTVSALAESESKLCATSVSLKKLEILHLELQQRYKVLLEQFSRMKNDAVYTVWTYCPDKSSEFRYLPMLDDRVVENATSLGDYDLQRQIGKGQFSTVMAGQLVKGAGSFCLRETEVMRDVVESVGMVGGINSPVFRADDSVRPVSPTQNHVSSADSTMAMPTHFKKLRPGNFVAIKIIPKDKVTNINAVMRVEKELRALIELKDSPNIVTHLESIHATRNMYIVNELMPMDLYDFMGKFKDRLTPVVAAVVLRELLEGLKFLEIHRVAHRDLKPENILVDVTKNEVVVKICDFNLCAFLPPDSSILCDFVGSPGFFAPEALLTRSFCAIKADMYSFGCIALEMLASAKFFSVTWMEAFACTQTCDAPNFSQAIKHATVAAQQELRRQHNSPMVDGIMSALLLQPKLRATPTALRSNSWITGASKFQAADTLNERQPRKVWVDLPSPVSMALTLGLPTTVVLPQSPACGRRQSCDSTTMPMPMPMPRSPKVPLLPTLGLLPTLLPLVTPSSADCTPGARGSINPASTQSNLPATVPEISVKLDPSTLLSLASHNLSLRRATIGSGGTALGVVSQVPKRLGGSFAFATPGVIGISMPTSTTPTNLRNMGGSGGGERGSKLLV